MNSLNLSNFRNMAFPLILSILGFFVGNYQKTNAAISEINKTQLEITYQIANSADMLQRIDSAVSEVKHRVEKNSELITKHTDEINKINVRVTYLEGKGVVNKR